MKLLGERNWYLPSWLQWLPRLEHGALVRADRACRPRSSPPSRRKRTARRQRGRTGPRRCDRCPFPTERTTAMSAYEIHGHETATARIALIGATAWSEASSPAPRSPRSPSTWPTTASSSRSRARRPGDHLTGGLVPMPCSRAGAVSYPRLRAGARATLALAFGFLGSSSGSPRPATTPSGSAPRATTSPACSASPPGSCWSASAPSGSGRRGGSMTAALALPAPRAARRGRRRRAGPSRSRSRSAMSTTHVARADRAGRRARRGLRGRRVHD